VDDSTICILDHAPPVASPHACCSLLWCVLSRTAGLARHVAAQRVPPQLIKKMKRKREDYAGGEKHNVVHPHWLREGRTNPKCLGTWPRTSLTKLDHTRWAAPQMVQEPTCTSPPADPPCPVPSITLADGVAQHEAAPPVHHVLAGARAGAGLTLAAPGPATAQPAYIQGTRQVRGGWGGRGSLRVSHCCS